MISSHLLKKSSIGNFIFCVVCKNMPLALMLECFTEQNTEISPNFLLWSKSLETLQKLCVSKNFHTRKLGGITLFYVVLFSQQIWKKFQPNLIKLLKTWRSNLYLKREKDFRKKCVEGRRKKGIVKDPRSSKSRRWDNTR